jgi:hypothetical protein
MGCDSLGQSVVMVIGRPLRLPWTFADDELGTCRYCDGLVRYRRPGRAACVLVCPGCLGGTVPGDVWIVPRELVANRGAGL